MEAEFCGGVRGVVFGVTNVGSRWAIRMLVLATRRGASVPFCAQLILADQRDFVSFSSSLLFGFETDS